MDKIVKTRQEHPCEICGFTIEAGSLAEYMEGRSAKYDLQDRQIGIEYFKLWIHKDASECKSGKLVTEKELEYIQRDQENIYNEN